MLMTAIQRNRQLYDTACTFERIFGSRCSNSLDCYGYDLPEPRFLLGQRITGEPTAALYLQDNVLVVSARDDTDLAELADFIAIQKVRQVCTTLRQARRLQAMLGGELETSCFMVHSGEPLPGEFAGIVPCTRYEDAYMVLQQSHEYYRTHLRFKTWNYDIIQRVERGFMEIYKVDNEDGEPIATGCIYSRDDTVGVVSLVAVVPEERHRGLGGNMSRFLTRRVLEQGLTPCLVCAYDGVAGLYRSLGYTEAGRWGELYL